MVTIAIYDMCVCGLIKVQNVVRTQYYNWSEKLTPFGYFLDFISFHALIHFMHTIKIIKPLDKIVENLNKESEVISKGVNVAVVELERLREQLE